MKPVLADKYMPCFFKAILAAEVNVTKASAVGCAATPINVGVFNRWKPGISHGLCIRSLRLTVYSAAVSVCRTETLRIMTGSCGTSAIPRDLTVFLLAMASTTPIPPVTLPNTA